MTRLHELHDDFGQSPWLDNLRRGWITGGDLARWVERGVRGITSNPTIFQKAILAGSDYDEQFADLASSGQSVEDSYWELVTADIRDALRILRPVHDASGGEDGFVSLELAPSLARDAEGSADAARRLHALIDEPNLYVKIPGTVEGIVAIRQMIAEGHSINVTLLFSIERYGQVIDAYLDGLEQLCAAGGDPSTVRSVASFFVSRVDTEADRRLESIGTPEAMVLRGRTAVANAKLAYALCRDRFRGARWEALAAQGAHVQRPLWASTSTKNPEYPDTMYVDPLIGDDTVNTMPEATLEAFEDHGSLAHTVDKGVDQALDHMARLADVGVDISDVTRTLEDEGVSAFAKSFDELLTSLSAKADDLRR